MTHSVHNISWRGIVLLCALVLNPGSSYAGQQKTAGQSIGQVSTNGDLIVIELNRAALGQPNLFDLVGRTLRFRPAGSRYRGTNQTLQWAADYGVELTGSDVRLQHPTTVDRLLGHHDGTSCVDDRRSTLTKPSAAHSRRLRATLQVELRLTVR